MKLLDSTLYDEERALERDSIRKGVDRYRRLAESATKRGDGAALQPTERLLAAWFPALESVIEREQLCCDKCLPGVGRAIYGPWLRRLSPEKCAVITLHSVLGRCLRETQGVAVSNLAMTISGAVMAEWNHERIQQMKGEALRDLMKTTKCHLRPHRVNSVAARHIACGECERRTDCRFALDPARWPLKTRGHLGAVLLNGLLSVAVVPGDKGVPFPAFSHEMTYSARTKRTTGIIKLSNPAREVIDAGHIARQFLRPKYQPMVIQPPPWTATDRGGYIELPVSLIKRTRHGAVPNVIHKAVNALNSTPWRINKRMLDVVERLWETGGNIADIPPKSRRLKPPLPEGATETTGHYNNGKPYPVVHWPSQESRLTWKKAAADTYRRNAQEESERVNFILKLDIAQRMAQYDRIYFPHQLDFRGRVYAVPLFLNHQGDDICRGLLEFADPVAPGPMGEYWLKIHLANSCGQDKVSFADRVKWVEGNEDTFRRWRSDPLAHTDWIDADKPLQALAAAYALDDRETAQRVPVQLDGSNNALQHYAAMLRNPDVAALVNLVPADVPQDFYADITAEAQRLVAQDAAAGNKVAQSLEGWIGRDLIKQPTMTVFYGVTDIGARRQLRARLNEAGFYAEGQYHASKYLAGLVLRAVALSCPDVHGAFRWLQLCARIIADSGQQVAWITPLDLPAIQPYKKTSAREVKTILQTITLRDAAGEHPVRRRKQTQAFPPNFVHAIDAAHLMNTAVRLAENGIAFAGVHDSYWTHAGDVPVMSAVIREEFVKLHRTPLLTELHQQLTARYPGLAFPPPPELGNLDVGKVMESDYAFS